MSPEPTVSVLMGVYNAAPYLDASIQSVLGQTYRNLELLLLDDGSSDDSAGILERWRRRDVRVRVHSLPHHGIAATLNEGIERARGAFIAIADHDDISLPERIARQVELMERRPEVGISGTGGWTLPGDQRWGVATDSDMLRCRLIFGITVVHPTMIMRRAWLDASGLRYDPGFDVAQDYDLIERASRQTVLANLSDALIRYRRHPLQSSRRQRAALLRSARGVRHRQIQQLGIDASAEDLDLHEALSHAAPPDFVDFGRRAHAWLERLAAANATTARYPEPVFSRVLAEGLYSAYARCPSLGIGDVFAFRRAGLDSTVCQSWKRSAGLAARALLPDVLRGRARDAKRSIRRLRRRV